MEKYKNKYRNDSIRLKNWDYGNNGAYFITICTQNRVHYFGKVVDKKFIPTELGEIAKKYWNEIPEKFPFIELGAFVVMPDHIHGVLIINKTNALDPLQTRFIASVSDSSQPQSKKPGGITGDKNPMFHENISRIIRWYKGRCSFEIRKIHNTFTWQPRFYDHIIRNMEAHLRIENYIIRNPEKWGQKK